MTIKFIEGEIQHFPFDYCGKREREQRLSGDSFSSLR